MLEFLAPIFGIGIDIAVAIAIFFVSFVLSGRVANFVKGLAEDNKKIDPTLASFFASTTRYAIVILGAVIAINTAGVDATALTAVLGASTLAIGLAMQGVLGNFAAGVMIMFFRPYKLGDFVIIADQSGTVIDIKMVCTVLTTLDNITIIVPNGEAWSNVITNYAQQSTRRVDWQFKFPMDTDRPRTISIARSTLAKSSYVLDEPESYVNFTDILNGHLCLTVRAWVGSADYFTAKMEILEFLLNAFKENGIELSGPASQLLIERNGGA